MIWRCSIAPSCCKNGLGLFFSNKNKKGIKMNPGICGIVVLNGQKIDESLFEQMKKFFMDGEIIESMCMDEYCLAQSGYQNIYPIAKGVFTRKNISICFEGRIDNLQSLFADLGLQEDTEYGDIIFLAYKKWGENLVKFLYGAFTLVIIDKNKEKVIMTNDHMALRKLFFHIDGSQLVFGSDIRQVLTGAHINSNLYLPKVVDFLSPLCVIDESWGKPEETFFEGVQMLDWATCVVVSINTGHVKKNRYWTPPQHLIRTSDNVQEYAIEFNRLFYEVILEQLENSCPTLGSELSGGVDSGALVCVISDILYKKTLFSGKNLHTYTLVFNNDGSKKECEKVESIKNMYPKITNCLLDSNDFFGYLELGSFRSCRAIHQPCRMNLPESFALLAKKASADGCKTLFSGEGADWYLEGSDVAWDSLIKSRNWSRLKCYIDVLLSRGSLRKVIKYLIRYGLRPLSPKWFSTRSYINEYYGATQKGDVPNVFACGFRRLLKECFSEQMKALLNKNTFENWSQRQEHDLLFPPNHKWQGVVIDPELYFPYLDRRIIEFGLQVPPEYKFVLSQSHKSHYGSRKMLQRVGFNGVVPTEVLWSQEKIRYGSSVVKRLHRYFNTVFNKREKNIHTADLGIVDVDKLMDLASSVVCSETTPEDHPLIPWLDSILGLELWLRANYEDGVFL